MQVHHTGFALLETQCDHYNGGQGAKRLFLDLTLLLCLHESCQDGSTLLNFRYFTKQPDFRGSGLICESRILKISLSHWTGLSILPAKKSLYTHS